MPLRTSADAFALDPLGAGVLIERARLRFAIGDVAGAFADSQTVIDNYPASEEPWELRATMAERLGRCFRNSGGRGTSSVRSRLNC